MNFVLCCAGAWSFMSEESFSKPHKLGETLPVMSPTAKHGKGKRLKKRKRQKQKHTHTHTHKKGRYESVVTWRGGSSQQLYVGKEPKALFLCHVGGHVDIRLVR